MFGVKHVVTATTASDGSATVYSPTSMGRVLSITYTKTDFTNGVDFVVSAEGTGQVIYAGTDVNASVTVRPRPPVQDEVGANATLNGTQLVREPVMVVNDRIKIVVASGGDTKTGTFTIVMG